MSFAYMLKETLKNLLRRPITVESIIKNESVAVPERYRGIMNFDREACIGCLMCVRLCPTGTILTTEDKKVLFRVDRCIFCGQCAEICPKNAITMSSRSDVITEDRKQLVVK